MIGRTLLHYEITAELGAGAMGRVYLARDAHTGRHVALKFLPAAGADAAARERLRREAGAAARLSHLGIVTLYSLEEAEGELFLVQEYIEGESLAARLRRGALGPAEVARLARELAAALAHAHAHGVLHRDLKPENVLIAADAHFKIADFGIARIEGAPTLTEAGTAVGSLSYMAPERMSGARGDARADLFGLGAVLYEAMSGKRAFPGEHEAAVTYAVMNEEPPPLDVPRSLEPLARLVMRLLAKEPAERPASAEVVAGLLAEMELTRVTAARPSPRRPWLPAAAAAALLIAAVGGAWWARGHFAKEAEAGEPAVAVLYFENVGDPADPERLGPITGNLLITSLAQVPELNVLGTQRILDAMRQESGDRPAADRSVALRVARRAHATRIVTGSILQTDPAMVMTAEVADVATGRVLHAERVEGAPGETVFQVVDRLGAHLLSRMVRAGEATRLQPLAQRTSIDLAAQRSYAEGLEALAHGDLESAMRSLWDAVRRDPQFAQAHYQLAIAQWWRLEPANARSSLTQARRYADRLSPMEQGVIEGLGRLVDSDWRGAREVFARLEREHPNERLVRYGQVEASFHGRDWTRAVEAAQRALAIDRDFALAGVHLVDALGKLGRLAEADSTARALLQRDPGNALLWYSLFHIALDRSDSAAALAAGADARAAGAVNVILAAKLSVLAFNLGRTVEPRSWLTPADTLPWMAENARLMVAYQRALRDGRFRPAERIARRAWQLCPSSGAPTGPAIPLADGVSAALGARDTVWLPALMDSLVSRFRRWNGSLAAANGEVIRVTALLAVGRRSEAADILRTLEARPEARTEYVAPFMDFGRGLVLGAEGRTDEALARLAGAASPGAPWFRFGEVRLARARVQLGAGRWAEALAGLDTLMSVPLLSPDDAVRLQFYRARCLEKLGRVSEATTSYREFLRIWKDADPGTPEVEEARAALRRLERVGQAAAGAGDRPARAGSRR